MTHVVAHYGLDRDTLHNHYYGKTQAARAALPEQRSLTEEQERSVEEWVERRDALDRYCTQEVDDWTATRPLHASLLKGDSLPM